MLGDFFTVISIFYAFRGLQIAAKVVQDWTKFRGPDFTPTAKNLAGQASFFLAVPIGVFFHELAHAIFVVVFGGQIIEFGYRVFWGFVRHNGFYLDSQSWFISLAGTLGSLLFGLAIWLALRNSASPTFRYFGLRAFRYQIFFSLVYYPIFTLMGFYGDWRTIYNFDATPILSGATAVFHAGALFLFWRADRSGFFEIGAFGSEETKEKITALEEKAAANPYDSQLQLQLIEAYRQGGMPRKATQQAQKFLDENPHSAEGHLQLAVLEAQGKEQIPGKAKDNALKAISLGLNNPEAVAAAYQLVGRFYFSRGKIEEAIDHYDQAINAVQGTDNQNLLIGLLYYRGQAYRRNKQYEAAYQEVHQAIQLARRLNLVGAINMLNTELETISRHAGRPLDQFTTPPFK